jgi:predicted SprT family Zn-dependent metalloprotease
MATNRPSASLQALARLWKHSRISRLQVAVNPRLRATIARWQPPAAIIEISPDAAGRGAGALREIICHEAAHVVVWDRHGRTARPHGKEWAALVRAAGFEPRASLVRCGHQTRRPPPAATYNHTCPVCHFSKRARRRMTRWRCPECRAVGLDGTLRIERHTSR